MNVLLNRCNHGFTLSEAQLAMFPGVALEDIDRTDPALIASFEAGDNRGDGGSTLQVFRIPNNVPYKIVAIDGYETLYWSIDDIHTV